MDDKIVVLSTDGYQYRANKEKLIEASDYFRAMFSNNFSEKDKDFINIEDIDHKSLNILIHYAETGALNIPNDGTLALLQTAAMLQFTDVQTACEREVFGSLSCESCLDIYTVTASLGLSSIAKSARIIALWNFRKISTMPQFLQLSHEALIEYLSDPSLITGPNGEWSVWEAIIRWIEDYEVERSLHLKELLCCLDFKLLTADDVSNMLFYSVVSESDEVVKLLECIRKCLSLYKDYSRTKMLSVKCFDISQTTDDVELQGNVEFHLNCLTRKASLCPSVVGFKRGYSKQKKKAKNSDDEDDYGWPTTKDAIDFVPVIYTLNQSSCKLNEEFAITKLCDGPMFCSGYQVCSVGPSVYILGGEYQLYGRGNWSHSVWRFSTATKKWIIENSLPKPRRHHMTCVLDSVIYILGGFGRHRVVQSSVNAYDTESGDWVSCPDMPHCVSHGAVCSFKGRVLVFTHEMQLLTYYPSMKKWSAVPLLSPSKHGYRAALPWKNFIYLIDNVTTKVYKYSPEEGQTVVEYGHFKASPINVCIVDGKIFNFSHDDSDDHVIEVLNIDEDIVENSSAQHINSLAQAECRDNEMNGEGINSERMESGRVSDASCEQYHISQDKEGHQLIASREFWREGKNGSFIFTTKFPAENTFSLGCFPLLKLP